MIRQNSPPMKRCVKPQKVRLSLVEIQEFLPSMFIFHGSGEVLATRVPPSRIAPIHNYTAMYRAS